MADYWSKTVLQIGFVHTVQCISYTAHSPTFLFLFLFLFILYSKFPGKDTFKGKFDAVKTLQCSSVRSVTLYCVSRQEVSNSVLCQSIVDFC